MIPGGGLPVGSAASFVVSRPLPDPVGAVELATLLCPLVSSVGVLAYILGVPLPLSLVLPAASPVEGSVAGAAVGEDNLPIAAPVGGAAACDGNPLLAWSLFRVSGLGSVQPVAILVSSALGYVSGFGGGLRSGEGGAQAPVRVFALGCYLYVRLPMLGWPGGLAEEQRGQSTQKHRTKIMKIIV